jgi:hypothetical protein
MYIGAFTFKQRPIFIWKLTEYLSRLSPWLPPYCKDNDNNGYGGLGLQITGLENKKKIKKSCVIWLLIVIKNGPPIKD